MEQLKVGEQRFVELPEKIRLDQYDGDHSQKDDPWVVELYKNETKAVDKSFPQRVLLRSIVCIEGIKKHTNIYISTRDEPFTYRSNVKEFLKTRIHDMNLFNKLFDHFGKRNKLHINNDYIIPFDSNRKKQNIIQVKLNGSTKEFFTGYKIF